MNRRIPEDSEKNQEYIDDLVEWMDHQYDPGYWTGGNIPPHIKYMKRPPRLFLIWLGLLIMLLSAYLFFREIHTDIAGCLWALLAFIIAAVIAFSNYRELVRQKRSQRKHPGD